MSTSTPARIPLSQYNKRLLIMGLIFAFIAVVVGCVAARMVVTSVVTGSWTVVPARILTVQLLGCALEVDGAHQVLCTYEYQIGGRTYRGARVGLHEQSDSIGSWHQDTYRALKGALDNNRPVTCCVDPADPNKSILVRTLRIDLLMFDMMFVLGFGGAGIGMCIYAARRARTPAPASPTVRPHMRLRPDWLNRGWIRWPRANEWMPTVMLNHLRWLRRFWWAVWLLWPAMFLVMLFTPSLAEGSLFGSLGLVMALLLGHHLLLRYCVRRFEQRVRDADFALCLRCGYPLRGLPPKHDCPECGTAYELNEVRKTWGKVLDDEIVDALQEGNWQCPHCGESVPANFTVCWNCEGSHAEIVDGTPLE